MSGITFSSWLRMAVLVLIVLIAATAGMIAGQAFGRGTDPQAALSAASAASNAARANPPENGQRKGRPAQGADDVEIRTAPAGSRPVPR